LGKKKTGGENVRTMRNGKGNILRRRKNVGNWGKKREKSPKQDVSFRYH